MKKFHYEYPWTENCCWMLPDDELMMQNQFSIMDEQIDIILELISRTEHGNQRTCVQAGGAFGMYPLRLADHFEHVFTFEPMPDNIECLHANLDDKWNVSPIQEALWHERAKLFMDYSKPVKNSYGAHHVNPDRGSIEIQGVPLDDHDFEEVDLLWLDVEGAELMALKGAESTLKRNRPVIVLEDHSLVQMKTVFNVRRDAAAKYLMNEMDYNFVGKTHHDLMFLPRSQPAR